MRLMWHSNAPWSPTGYGVQTALVVPRLRDRLGHDVAISASWGLLGGVLSWDGISVYPAGFHPYGMDIWGGHAKEWKADAMLSLLDAWVCEPAALEVPWMPWFPVDMTPTPPAVLEKVRLAALPVTMSRFAHQQVSEEGVANTYVPHCYDPGKLYRDDDARKAARDMLGADDESFVFGIVAANKGGWPSRKSIPAMIEAFARIASREPKALLYVHTHVGTEMQGVDVPGLCRMMGCIDRLRAPDQYRNHSGLIGPDYMRGVYNGIDVLVNTSMGEGFGIPILEAQACGCPVIACDWTAMAELVWAGWKVNLDESEPFANPLGAWMRMPHIDAIEQAMTEALALARDSSLKQDATKGAVGYQADHVIDTYWKPALELLARMLAERDPARPAATLVSTLSGVRS